MAVTNDKPISTANLKAVCETMDRIWGGVSEIPKSSR